MMIAAAVLDADRITPAVLADLAMLRAHLLACAAPRAAGQRIAYATPLSDVAPRTVRLAHTEAALLAAVVERLLVDLST